MQSTQTSLNEPNKKLCEVLSQFPQQLENVQLRIHCNVRQPNAAQSLSALIRRLCQVWGHSVYPLPSFSCWYVTLHCDLELWPRDLNLWPWTFVVYWRCRSQSLYEIWAQSGNPWRSYCSLKFDLMTLNMYHVLCYGVRYFTQSLNSVKLWVHEM